jgi:acetyl esterase/lipase
VVSTIRYRRAELSAILVLSAGVVAWGQPPGGAQPTPAKTAPRIPPNVVLESDVKYGQAGEIPLLLDIIRPAQPSEKPRPVIAFIHGGAWSGGSKERMSGPLVPFAAAGDYFCVSIEYRLSGVATWPAQIHDCKAAIRWLRSNARTYHIDPDKIGVWGSSAGGHLVSMLGVSADVPALEGDCGTPGVSSRVACVVDYCGPSDFMAIARVKESKQQGAYGPASRLLGGPIEENEESARSASPVSYASKQAAPFLIVHGSDDTTVPPEQADLLDAALKAAGADVTFIKIVGGTHAVAPSGGPNLLERVKSFFARHLRDQDVSVSDEPIPSQPPRQPQP